jgi:(1->4)-alpha-D-glucan 1-alpha-D-glucosylmutase
VDYIRRRKALQTMNELQNPSFTDIANDLTKNPGDGRIKMFLIWKALSVRQQHPDLFDKGEYLQLTVRGKKASHAVAFARRQAATTLVIVVPRLVGKLLDGMDDPPTGKTVWGDTNVLLPFPSKQFRNAFTDERLDPRATGNTSEFAMSEALATFPVALFVSQ